MRKARADPLLPPEAAEPPPMAVRDAQLLGCLPCSPAAAAAAGAAAPDRKAALHAARYQFNTGFPRLQPG